MKLNKLVIAMGLASVVLAGCGSDNDETQSVTAVDGYIVNGLVATTCGGTVFTGRTNETGIASISTSVFALSDCSGSSITGDDTTYDYDLGKNVAWKHTMKTLKGLSVINPYTDIAVTAVENDPTLDNAGALAAVYEILGIPASLIVGGTDLFVDFGTNNANSDPKLAVLAETTFATIIKLKDKVPDAKAVNLVSLYQQVLPQVSTAVDAYITANPGLDLSKVVFTVTIPLPATIEFDDAGAVIVTPELEDITIIIDDIVKPEPPTTPDATGTGTGTGTEGVNQG